MNKAWTRSITKSETWKLNSSLDTYRLCCCITCMFKYMQTLYLIYKTCYVCSLWLFYCFIIRTTWSLDLEEKLQVIFSIVRSSQKCITSYSVHLPLPLSQRYRSCILIVNSSEIHTSKGCLVFQFLSFLFLVLFEGGGGVCEVLRKGKYMKLRKEQGHISDSVIHFLSLGVIQYLSKISL